MKTSDTRSLVALDSGRSAVSTILACSFVVGALLLNYWGVILALLGEWWVNTQYSYGFLILPISLYLVWSRRERLSRVQKKPSIVAGGVLLASGLLLLIVGHAGGVIALQQISLVVTLAGLVLLVLGWAVLGIVWFPILYLILAIPVWDLLTEKSHLPFQLLSARIGAALLRLIGIPSYLDGIYISLPKVTLEVGRLCSGVNFLIAVVALGIPMAYLYIEGWTRRMALVLSSVAIAILSNGLRVTLVGILVHYHIGNATHGPFHIFQGMFVSVIGFIALIAGVWILGNRQPGTRYREASLRYDDPLARVSVPPSPGIFLTSILVATILLLAAGYAQHQLASVPVPLSRDLSGFPLQLGNWSAARTAKPVQGLSGLGATDLFSEEYVSSEGEIVGIQIAYFDSQSQGREIVNYSTRSFHYGSEVVTFDIPGYGPISVNKVRQRNGSGTRSILFWYDIGGKVITSRLHAKILTTLGALFSGKTNGAFILLFHETDGEPPPGDTLGSFLKTAYPVIRRYLP